jgi:hypothetical protein
MYDLDWWAVGTAASFIPVVGPYLGAALGLVPIIQQDFSPTIFKGTDNNPVYNHAYANGTTLDPNCVGRGTASFEVQVRFYPNGGQTAYTFAVRMASWIGTYGGTSGISYMQDITFNVKWE